MKIKNFIFLTFAGIINAFGITIFLAPVDLYDSGISGTSMLCPSLLQAIFPCLSFLYC